MDISDPVIGSNSQDKKKYFPSKMLLSPMIFLKDLFSYIFSRSLQLYRFSSALGDVISTIITRLKNILVSRLFWGRGDLYRVFFRTTLIVVLISWVYSSLWGGYSFAGSLQSDSTFVLQQKDFEIELGSSAPPIDEDRPRDSVREYVVQGGDTLSTIAEKFDVSISTIKWANDLSSDYIRPGQKLKILPVTGVLHKVKSGDTLAALAEKYNASEQAIADVNWIDPPFILNAGQELMVPGGEIKVAPPPPPVAVVATAPPVTRPQANVSSSTPVTGTGQFMMPTTGFISQYYHAWHKAIDVASRALPPIVASDAGRVVYSGWDSTGYGLTVLLDHGNGFLTRYAHGSALYVKTGEYVNRGQTIMQMGSTGRSTGPHLHFEIIRNGVKQNPMAYL